MRPITVTVGPLAAASANNIALSQTPTAAFTLNGSTAGVLDAARRVLLTQAANESGKTFTIVGTDINGSSQTEVLAAAASATTVQSALDFKTVTSVTISSAAAGAITIGTNGVASSMWIRLDDWAPTSASVQVTVTGTANYTVQVTMQDPNSPTNPVLPYQVSWQPHPDPNLVGATTSWYSSNLYSPTWMRLLVNSGATGTANVSMTVTQNSSVTY
jgi:hypothetical protein